MASWQGIYVVVLLLVLKCDGQITSSLQDEIKCTSDSITLSWAYTTTNEIVAVWQFGTSTIMTVPVGGSPIIESAYTSRATHGGNGALTLTGLTTGDSGTYSLSITYSVAPVSASDSVQVTVYDKIMQESTPQCGTDTVTCGSSSMSGVSYSWTVDGAAVSDTSWSISSRSGTKTYACTISGDRVTNCLDAGISTTQSASCTFTEPGPSPGVVAAIVCCSIAAVAGIVAAVVVGLKKKYPCQKGSNNKKPDSGNSGSRSVTPNQVSPSIITTDKKIERPSKVDEKNTKPLSPATLALTNEAKPGGRALPPIPQHEKKKKTPRKKKKRVKTEDGEDTEKLPPIQKKERNIEHYTRDTQDPES